MNVRKFLREKIEEIKKIKYLNKVKKFDILRYMV